MYLLVLFGGYKCKTISIVIKSYKVTVLINILKLVFAISCIAKKRKQGNRNPAENKLLLIVTY